jgi:hypothetical protein
MRRLPVRERRGGSGRAASDDEEREQAGKKVPLDIVFLREDVEPVHGTTAAFSQRIVRRGMREWARPSRRGDGSGADRSRSGRADYVEGVWRSVTVWPRSWLIRLDELPRAERLRDVVVGAHVEAHLLVDVPALGREQDHRDLARLRIGLDGLAHS